MLVWLAIDGLFLWQFMGIIDSPDPMIAKVGETLRARIKATPEIGFGPSNTSHADSPVVINHAERSET